MCSEQFERVSTILDCEQIENTHRERERYCVVVCSVLLILYIVASFV